jgi:hypothetical protein
MTHQEHTAPTKTERDTQASFGLSPLPHNFAPLQEAVAARAAFVERYKVDVLGEHQVSFEIPAGVARIDILREAQKIMSECVLYGRVVQPQQLEKWEKDPQFLAPVSTPKAIGINCVVLNTGGMTRSEQERFLAEQGLALPSISDLAVAHALFSVATQGRNAFGEKGISHTVRAADGTLFSFVALTADVFFPHPGQVHEALVAASYIP